MCLFSFVWAVSREEKYVGVACLSKYDIFIAGQKVPSTDRRGIQICLFFGTG